MGAASRRAKKIRKAGEFDTIRLAQALQSPIRSTGFYTWDLDTMASARAAQMIGNFRLPYRLAQAMKSAPDIHKALKNSLAPIQGLPIELCPPNTTARAKRVLDEADAQFGPAGVACSIQTFKDLGENLRQHGVAIGHNVLTSRPGGDRVDIEHHCWPIEFVYWQATTKTYRAMTHAGELETVVHGNGRWTIYTEHELAPWTWGCVIPATLVWANGGFGRRDEAKAGKSHGNAKMVGQLPEGIAIDSPEGVAFLQMLEAMHDTLPFGIKPFGASVDMLVNNSQAWQIFKDIIDRADQDAEGIYLGQRSSVTESSQRLSATQLFGVRDDIVRSYLGALQRGFYEGVIQPWAAINFGDSSLAPERRWLMPDPEQDARKGSLIARRAAFWEDIEAAKAANAVVDQDYVNSVAKAYDIDPPTITAHQGQSAGPSSQPGQPATPTPAPAPPPSLPNDVQPLRRVR